MKSMTGSPVHHTPHTTHHTHTHTHTPSEAVLLSLIEKHLDFS